MKRNFKLLFFTILLSFIFTANSALALDFQAKFIVKTNGELIDWQTATVMRDENGTDYVPLRELCEHLGLDIKYDNEARTLNMSREYSNEELPEYLKELGQENNLLLVKISLDYPIYQTYLNDEFLSERTTNNLLSSDNDVLMISINQFAAIFDYELRFSKFTRTYNIDEDEIVTHSVGFMETTIEDNEQENIVEFLRDMMKNNCLSGVIHFTGFKGSREELDQVYISAYYYNYYDNPEFAINFKESVITTTKDNNEFTMKVTINPKQDGEIHNTIAQAAAKDLYDYLHYSGKVYTKSPDFVRAKSIREYFLRNGDYVKNDGTCYTPWGVFTEGKGVCHGYSGAYKMMLELEGIECGIEISEAHMWNTAILDDEKYYIDATPTWDKNKYFTTNEELFREHNEHIKIDKVTKK